MVSRIYRKRVRDQASHQTEIDGTIHNSPLSESPKSSQCNKAVSAFRRTYIHHIFHRDTLLATCIIPCMGYVLGVKAHSYPTSAPTEYPYNASTRYTMMMTSQLISIIDRVIIMVICIVRLWNTRAQCIERCDAKVVFHVLMLLTVPLCLPNFVFCAVHADIWQCYMHQQTDDASDDSYDDSDVGGSSGGNSMGMVTHLFTPTMSPTRRSSSYIYSLGRHLSQSSNGGESDQLYNERWGLYAMYRFGLCLQLMCLSVTVLTWATFLDPNSTNTQSLTHFSKFFSIRNAPTKSDRQLRIVIFGVNILSVISAVITCSMMVANPEQVETSNGNHLTMLVYLNWIILDFFQLCMASFMLIQGFKLYRRINYTGALNQQDRKNVLRKLIAVLVVIISCILTEVFGRLVLSSAVFSASTGAGGGKDGGTGGDNAALYDFLENEPVAWQFVGYILPYDVVSFCLLYLMRASPNERRNAVSSTTDQTRSAGIEGADSPLHERLVSTNTEQGDRIKLPVTASSMQNNKEQSLLPPSGSGIQGDENP